MDAATDIPELVAHVTLAIYAKARIPGPRAERFAQALEIALSQLRKQGFLQENTDRIVLTSKGRERDREHQNDPGQRAKRLSFNAHYAALEEMRR